MPTILRNILAVIAGLLIGGFVNSSMVALGSNIIPPPPGVDPMDVESIKANIHLYEVKHFIIPFIAHAFGTLLGAFLCALFAASHKLKLAMVIGVFFLLGGIAMVMMVPGPIWFTIFDLLFAYIPMAWLGWRYGHNLIN